MSDWIFYPKFYLYQDIRCGLSGSCYSPLSVLLFLQNLDLKNWKIVSYEREVGERGTAPVCDIAFQIILLRERFNNCKINKK